MSPFQHQNKAAPVWFSKVMFQPLAKQRKVSRSPVERAKWGGGLLLDGVSRAIPSYKPNFSRAHLLDNQTLVRLQAFSKRGCQNNMST